MQLSARQPEQKTRMLFLCKHGMISKTALSVKKVRNDTV